MSKITFGKKSESAKSVKPKDEQTLDIPTEKKRRRQTPRKPKESFRPIREGDLHQVIIDALKGKYPLDGATFKTMKSGFARRPFGGKRKGGGGWNATAYAIFEAIERSGKVYVKKE